MILVSVYLVQGIGIADENVKILWELAQRVAEWNSLGFDWIIGGDWNTDITAVNVRGWIEALAGMPMLPDAPTCYTSNGHTTIDYFILTANLASRVHTSPGREMGLQVHS